MPKLTKGKARVPIAKEIKRIVSVLKDSKYALRDLLLIDMSYLLGLRVHELAALALKDVIRPDGTITEDMKLPKAKGNKPDYVYLTNPKVLESLRLYIEERRKQAEDSGKELNLDEPLFLSQKKGFFTSKTLQMKFDRIYKAAGVEGASSHSGRRYFATMLSESHIDLKSIQILMRHKSISTTAGYIAENPVRLRKILAKIIY